ncbi:DUF1176 domain-containing protein [Candidatus Halocynthiibacter alkanivorans]|uniref:DUF1176 domain-containing protein n=1 Tax=Candidatus Halocynthiibacter alkanivorans TaxID=2267619 RepID=UPI001358D456|nr:DUF1176 domain-containing protein [Candidatus Halocynthiibacter alkanivorans]
MKSITSGAVRLYCQLGIFILFPGAAAWSSEDVVDYQRIEQAALTFFPEDTCVWAEVGFTHENTLTWAIQSPVQQGVQAEGKSTLIHLECSHGAYNFLSVWMIEQSDGELRPVSFPSPWLSRETTPPSVMGIGVTYILFNSGFDPDTRTITSYAMGRGMGGAHSAGAWVLRGNRFLLTNYEVDNTFDLVVNPVTVYSVGE